MGALFLDSLEIRNFRAFRHLTIERFGRVNLIVGKNNVGKSCLLEALRLYAKQGSQALVWELLEARDETGPRVVRSEEGVKDEVSTVKYLFYGRRDTKEYPDVIQIGPLNSPETTLTLAVGWYAQVDQEGRRELKPLLPKEYDTVENPVLGLATQVGTQPKTVQRLSRRSGAIRPPDVKGTPNVFVSANGLEDIQIGQLWDGIALTDLEEDVLASLHIIASEVQRVNLVGDQSYQRYRYPIVRVAGSDAPIPIRNMGEGMNRIFGVALALVSAREGVLLIDEIESGLHYSVQSELWRLIFAVAHRLNIQVFATTHSWDCIQAFQQAAQGDEHEEGLLIRLESKMDSTLATLFGERKLGIATREQIEVR